MPAIITDQFRILNAETFVQSLTGIGTTANYYYTFLGHPNPRNVEIDNYGATDWIINPPDPKDSFEQENTYHDSMLFLKRVNSSDVSRIIPRYDWSTGVTYDMYRNNYDINNGAPQSNSKTLYGAKYVVVNSEFKVYICLNNGSEPGNTAGKPSLVEPNFVSTDPQSQTDGYLWKYLYTITPADVIKFSTEKYIPVPKEWGDVSTLAVKNAAVDGKIETAVIKSRGSGYDKVGSVTTGTGIIENVPIKGDGTGGEVAITISGGEITKVEVTSGGTGYTVGVVNFTVTDLPTKLNNGTGGEIEIIIPPKGGHGNDIYRELGTHRVMIYSKYDTNSDFIIGNDFSRVGIVKNPTKHSSNQLINTSTATNLGALKLKPQVASASTSEFDYPLNAKITQHLGVGNTAVGYVASWDRDTGVLRYYQPAGLSKLSTYGYELLDFVGGATASPIVSVGGTANLIPDAAFHQTNTILSGEKHIDLGQTFNFGKANPDVERYSGEIIYIDNRAPVTRSASQKEEVKIVVEF